MIDYSMLHKTQAAILQALSNADAPVSPNELSNYLGEPLGNVSYHVKVLAGLDGKPDRPGKWADAPLLELSHTEPRRGAVEHFYITTDRALVVPSPSPEWWKTNVVDSGGAITEEDFKRAVNGWAERAGFEAPFEIKELAVA